MPETTDKDLGALSVEEGDYIYFVAQARPRKLWGNRWAVGKWGYRRPGGYFLTEEDVIQYVKLRAGDEPWKIAWEDVHGKFLRWTVYVP